MAYILAHVTFEPGHHRGWQYLEDLAAAAANLVRSDEPGEGISEVPAGRIGRAHALPMAVAVALAAS